MTLFTEVVEGPTGTTAAVANATALSNLTLPQHARLITRIWVSSGPVNFNVAEPHAGYVRVTSEDCSIGPMEIPFEIIPGFVTVGGGVQREPHKWIVNCPVPGGAKLSFDSVEDVTSSAAGEVQVIVEFSDGGSPFPGGQLHMKMGEPAVALGTSGDVAIANSNIDIKASKLHAVFGYAMETQPTADQGCPSTVSVASEDFAVAGPFKFAWNMQPGGVTNRASSGVDLTVIETDRAFRVAKQKQTIKCTTTPRDTMTGDGVSNWGVIYS